MRSCLFLLCLMYDHERKMCPNLDIILKDRYIYIYICCINLANMHEFHLVLQE